MSGKRPLHVRLILNAYARLTVFSLVCGVVLGLFFMVLEPLAGEISAGLIAGLLAFDAGVVGEEIDHYYLAPLLRRLYSDRSS